LLGIGASAGHAGMLGGFEPGIRLGSYTDNSDFFVGVDGKFNVLGLNADPSIEYVFVDDATLMTFNLDALVDVIHLPVISGWLGAGVGLMYFDTDASDSSTDPVANLIAGFGINVLFNPYVMAKWIFADNNDGFVISAGVHF
jgi:hypothetical protein